MKHIVKTMGYYYYLKFLVNSLSYAVSQFNLAKRGLMGSQADFYIW